MHAGDLTLSSDRCFPKFPPPREIPPVPCGRHGMVIERWSLVYRSHDICDYLHFGMEIGTSFNFSNDFNEAVFVEIRVKTRRGDPKLHENL